MASATPSWKARCATCWPTENRPATTLGPWVRTASPSTWSWRAAGRRAAARPAAGGGGGGGGGARAGARCAGAAGGFGPPCRRPGAPPGGGARHTRGPEGTGSLGEWHAFRQYVGGVEGDGRRLWVWFEP